MLSILRSGWSAIAFLLLCFALFFVIIFVTFPQLRQFSGGLEPFDGMAAGYTFEEAQRLLAALGEDGRYYYALTQLRLDTFYPATYGISRALALLWLAAPGRARKDGFSRAIRIALTVFPLVVTLLDWTENAMISKMLESWSDLNPALVAYASGVSAIKSIGVMVTDSLMIAMFAAYLWRRFRRL